MSATKAEKSFEHERLALLHGVVESDGNPQQHLRATGYLITPDLILTAGHLFRRGQLKELRVRLGIADHEDWKDAESTPVWHDPKLDAALVRIRSGLQTNTAPPKWARGPFKDNVAWKSAAYPKAAVVRDETADKWKTAGLRGMLYAHGGRGQGPPELELGVEDSCRPEDWEGISGAPIVLEQGIAGILKEVSADFDGKRLFGVPIRLILDAHGFLNALAPKLCLPSTDLWVLVLDSETKDGKAANDPRDVTTDALERFKDEIEEATEREISPKPLSINVCEAVSSPERWFQAVETLCRAPIVIADVTGFEPASMLLLGIRAVARRGVTIAVTAKPLKEESVLAELPFNIKETKLIDLSTWRSRGHNDPANPISVVAHAIKEGVIQLGTDPAYLDLPAYDAVRCSLPGTEERARYIERAVLMLCPFHSKYLGKYWPTLSRKISAKTRNATLLRMLDITSPRLVGLALYQHIRWTRRCVVDWTFWRPNVFFELGVRLACSAMGAISIFEKIQSARLPSQSSKSAGRRQKEHLLRLFSPEEYSLPDADSITKAVDNGFGRFEATMSKAWDEALPSGLRQDDTYRIVEANYDVSQDRLTQLPHEELRSTIELLVGKDPQDTASSSVLFSSNAKLRSSLQRSVLERWIAAWLYLAGRYQREELAANVTLRKAVVEIGQSALEALEPHKSIPGPYQRIHERVSKDLEEMRGM